MTKILDKKHIEKILDSIDVKVLLQAIEDGFIAYSDNKVIAPPVGHLGFLHPPGDVHIKYGYIKNDDCYVVKVASSFYENPKNGLHSSNGLMLVFDSKTGELLSILLDEGYLTDVRTAFAGAVVAKYLAPSTVKAIGIVGTGTQARLQLQYLQYVTECKRVFVWGRSKKALESYRKGMEKFVFDIILTENIEEVTNNCNLIVTTTPSTKPLIFANQIQPGTHITAMGADSEGKQELDPQLFTKADVVLADSIEQCIDHGDISHAVKGGILGQDKIIELGSLIKIGAKRENDEQITIADLTGVAVQDIQITKAILSII